MLLHEGWTIIWTTENLFLIACSSAVVIIVFVELMEESDNGPGFLSIPDIKSIDIMTKMN